MLAGFAATGLTAFTAGAFVDGFAVGSATRFGRATAAGVDDAPVEGVPVPDIFVGVVAGRETASGFGAAAAGPGGVAAEGCAEAVITG
jgi:hypothetical protein